MKLMNFEIFLDGDMKLIDKMKKDKKEEIKRLLRTMDDGECMCV